MSPLRPTPAAPARRRVALETAGVCAVVGLVGLGALAWVLRGALPLAISAAAEAVVTLYAVVWARAHAADLRRLDDDTPLASIGPANALTFARMALVPIAAVGLLLAPDSLDVPRRVVFGALLALLFASDGLDGFVARRRGEATRFGAFLDPTADFFFALVLTTALAARGALPWWFAALVVGRVVLLMVGGVVVMRRGGVDRTRLAAQRLGKPAVAGIIGCVALSAVGVVVGATAPLAPWVTGTSVVVGVLVVLSLAEKAVLFRRLVR